MSSNELFLKVKNLPQKPGVYQFYNNEDKIIYVGKAKNLLKRVGSYFAKKPENGKTAMLVKQIHDFRFVVVDSELDALLLENNLIKEYQPKYNIQLKDDKTYPWICVKNEFFPRVFSTRQKPSDGSKYYGPYANVKVLNTLISLIKELYLLRTCSLDLHPQKIKEKKYKVCLEYHIGNCKAPCVGFQSLEDYNSQIQQIEWLLKGNISSVIQFVKEQMMRFSNEQAFEQAHEMKEKLNALEQFQAKSTIVSSKIHEVDALSLLFDEDRVFFNYLCIHNGAIIHAYTGEAKKKLNESKDEVFSFILAEMHNRYQSKSKEVLVDEALNFKLDAFNFSVPKIGDKKKLLELSQRNVRFYFEEKRRREQIKDPERHSKRVLEQIQKDFRLAELPVHIECFDNSNFHGTNAVSACVVFKNAKPSKKDYRHFNVKTVEGPDDFATMEEVVHRRYKRLLDEDASLPQLIVIDGGKGQLGAALNALEKLNLRGKVAIVGIAKRLEEIFFPGDSLPIYIDKRSESLKVIQQLRNEAHRFGITHHRNKRSKSSLNSELDEIKGIGPKIKEKLFNHFKTIKNIKNADEKMLIDLIGEAKTQLLTNHWSQK